MAAKHVIEIALLTYLAHKHCGTFSTTTAYTVVVENGLSGKFNAPLLCQSVTEDTNMPNVHNLFSEHFQQPGPSGKK